MSFVQVKSQTGTGQSTVTKVLPANPFHIGFGVVVSGTVTYTIEHTFNGIDFFPNDFVVGATANADGNIAFPIAGLRVNVTAGAGTATLTAIQARG